MIARYILGSNLACLMKKMVCHVLTNPVNQIISVQDDYALPDPMVSLEF